jgi:hypothetical protein
MTPKSPTPPTAAEAVATVLGKEPDGPSLATIREHRSMHFTEGTTLEMLYRQIKAGIMTALVVGDMHESAAVTAIAIWDDLHARGEMALSGTTPAEVPQVNTRGAKNSEAN